MRAHNMAALIPTNCRPLTKQAPRADNHSAAGKGQQRRRQNAVATAAQ
jgi:hypothetical protein